MEPKFLGCLTVGVGRENVLVGSTVAVCGGNVTDAVEGDVDMGNVNDNVIPGVKVDVEVRSTVTVCGGNVTV